MTPIQFPSAHEAKQCAARLVRTGRFPYARHAIRQVSGLSSHVVLTIGENILTA